MATKTARPRRRQRPLGLAKKRTVRKHKQADPSGPTDEEFAALKTFKSARVLDAEGNEHEFSTDDDVLVVPSGKDPNTAHLLPDTENWVAKIRKIARRSDGEVWAKVEWYWSPQHVASIVKSFDLPSYAAYELFPDIDFQNYIPVESIVDTVKVIQYDDCDLEPPFIGPTTFFCRHVFRPKIKHVTPFSSKEVCSICQQPYNPDAAQRSPELLTMHFCPRETCQAAWHRQCLSTHPITKRPTCTDRKLSLLCSIPSVFLKSSVSPSASTSTSSPSLLSLLSKSEPAPPQSQPGTRKRRRLSEADALSLFGDLPPDLIQLASQPIVKPTFKPSGVGEEAPKRRKGKGKAPKEPRNVIHNVAGNITTVLKARVLINDVVRGITILPRDWRKKIGWDDDAIPSIIVDDDENDQCPPLLCPTCGEHI
ncbi:hypothetical protein BDM02DRAFT_2782687 [Thelephora ganbajun]|uniref:Uncharacterized protein n=1 Tax=Thelephora ganbajun TaxID=370292 RepID=A0ACB6ZSX4_THEGA|nr:hypothetical protein BDM02DRAFT_2782687 [Thelephora ganbajun]